MFGYLYHYSLLFVSVSSLSTFFSFFFFLTLEDASNILDPKQFSVLCCAQSYGSKQSYLWQSSIDYVCSRLGQYPKCIHIQNVLTHYYIQDVPKVIPWEKLDHIAYAFAVPDRHGDLGMFEEEQLQQGICFKSKPTTKKPNKFFILVVEEAHNHGKGVSLAIGG